MLRILPLLTGLLVLALSVADPALAAPMQPFDRKAFQKAASEGKTIVLHFQAPWCPTCRRQEPVLKDILVGKAFGDYAAFRVDYDSATDLRTEFQVVRQSTIVVLKGWKEVGRSISEVELPALVQLLKKGL